MFPLRDSHATYKFPLITTLLIIVNVLVFFLELTAIDTEVFIENYALIPSKVEIRNYFTWIPFITSQFLHAGFLHLISNMWFLRIFGDNVEEKFGSFFFLVVYLTSGVVGGFVQYIFSPDSAIPMLGASGAVAGILGAYFVFFPHHKIETLVPIGLFMTTVRISASIMLLYWFVTQLFSGVGSVAVSQTGGVAFWAHIGGFAAGYIVAKLSQGSASHQVEEGEIIGADF
ncbi:hypothetical protein A2Z67_01865 [Candidatus Woesebacteria bacterium RBG_13_36_22]|uniref:Peptidase S54 rhomboid domain-containing protein n=1 Tax=Candidatus Woesebacteria bacterium RBG_13_36_22 TaxID=1802478 RepID=A0A1F7X126_9BACT|nr:MAG: hypothetical protein A2Z67_01865 [Candidatus Woesebacteria bacterium RBG_13_36_22]